MTPTITCQCPSCGKDIVITGVKLLFDNPQHPPQHKQESKGYVGWQGSPLTKASKQLDEADNKETIKVDNTGDPNEDVGKMVKDIVDKTPQPYIDPAEDMGKAIDDALKKNRLKKEEMKAPPKEEPKKEDELIPLLKKLIPLLDEKIYPELHTFVSALLGEETKKEESKKRFTAW